VEYCETALQADILTISNIDEKDFWIFYLFSYLNTTENVWLKSFDNKSISDLNVIDEKTIEKTNLCFALQSAKGAQYNKSNIEDIIKLKCNSFGSTVCEISNKPQKSKPIQDKRKDPNSEFFQNKKIKLSNGNETEIFTGLYYVISSKYENQIFISHLIGKVSIYYFKLIIKI